MDETMALLLKEGIYLITIEHHGFSVSLYSLVSEFYEVFYNPTDYRIEKIVQASEEDLNKYLNRIELMKLQ